MTREPIVTDVTDVTIIGAGPIGLELAVALRRRGADFRILDAGPIGQTMSWWAPHTRWFSSNERIAIAGVPLETPDQSKATREQYLAYLRSIAKQFRIDVRTYEKAVAIRPAHGGGFRIETESQGGRRCLPSRKVVLAIGGTDRPRELGIEGEGLPHVDGYLREPHRYFGRRVLVVGGRNSAVEAALRLHHAGARVAISYRRAQLPGESIKYWLRPEIEGLIASGRIKAQLGTVPVRITPTEVWLRRVDGDGPPASDQRPVGDVDDGDRAQRERTEDTRPDGSDEIVRVPADDVLKLVGYVQDKSLFRQAGIELVGPESAPRHDPETMESNVPGLYVAGTAVAGTQSSRYQTFLENCHVHVDRIVAHLGLEDRCRDGDWREGDWRDGHPGQTRAAGEPRVDPADEAAGALRAEIRAMPES